MEIINSYKQKSNKIKNEKNKNTFFVFLFLILVFLDQLTKYLAKNVFRNYQFAFSLPLPILSIYLVYAVVLVAMLGYCFNNRKQFTKKQSIAWIFIFAGAASNISERIVTGYVKDWIYMLTGVFNLADGYIIAGILLLVFGQIDINDKIDKIEQN